MGGIDPGSAREEAERLVTTALAAARLAAAGAVDGGSDGRGPGPLGSLGSLGEMISGVLGASSAAGPGASVGHGGTGAAPGGGHFATGSAECCVCPICRAIVALRDPSPEFAERLATGAGDFAAGVASLLRAFSTATASGAGPDQTAGEPPRPAAPDQTAGEAPRPAAPEDLAGTATGPDTPSGTGTPRQSPAPGSEPGADQMWREATRTGHDSWAAPEQDVWAAATRTDVEGRSGGAGAPADATGTADVAGPARRTRTGTDDGRPMAHEAISRPMVPASRTPASGTDEDDASGDAA